MEKITNYTSNWQYFGIIYIFFLKRFFFALQLHEISRIVLNLPVVNHATCFDVQLPNLVDCFYDVIYLVVFYACCALSLHVGKYSNIRYESIRNAARIVCSFVSVD